MWVEDTRSSTYGMNRRSPCSQPHVLNRDESKFLQVKSKKASTKSYQGTEKVVAYSSGKTATVRDFVTKECLGEFEKSDSFSGVTISTDESTVFLADPYGNIQIYDVSSGYAPGRVFKVLKTLSLPNYEKIKVFDLEKNEEEKQRVRQTLILSPNGQHIVGCYQGITSWEAFLWCIKGNFIRRIAGEKRLEDRYPVFTGDSQYLIIFDQRSLKVLLSEDGSTVKLFRPIQTIRDVFISSNTNDICVLTSKDVVMLELIGMSTVLQQKRKAEPEWRDIELLPREQISQSVVHPRITLIRDEIGDVKAVEETGLASANHDLFQSLNSARDRTTVAFDTLFTPDGTRVVQLFARAQVVDLKVEDIVCSPKNGDTIQRVLQQSDTPGQQTSSSTIEISNGMVMNLISGDRITNAEQNKVKFRINEDGRWKIFTIPSVVVVAEKTNNSRLLKKMHRFVVHQESFFAISNRHLVTRKTKKNKHFINLYSLETGKLLTTHECPSLPQYSKISDDETRLFVAGNDLHLHVYSGVNFIEKEISIKIANANEILNSKVCDILNSSLKPTTIVLKYSKAAGGFQYVSIDLASRQVSPVTDTQAALEDVSKDGSLAVDDRLTLYDLRLGVKLPTQVSYDNSGINMQLQARISDDNKFLVFLDKQDDTLHVVQLLETGSTHVVSWFNHLPNIPVSQGLIIRQSGRLVVLKSGTNLMFFVIRDCSAPSPLAYNSEAERAASLINSIRSDVPLMPLWMI